MLLLLSFHLVREDKVMAMAKPFDGQRCEHLGRQIRRLPAQERRAVNLERCAELPRKERAPPRVAHEAYDFFSSLLNPPPRSRTMMPSRAPAPGCRSTIPATFIGADQSVQS